MISQCLEIQGGKGQSLIEPRMVSQWWEKKFEIELRMVCQLWETKEKGEKHI